MTYHSLLQCKGFPHKLFPSHLIRPTLVRSNTRTLSTKGVSLSSENRLGRRDPWRFQSVLTTCLRLEVKRNFSLDLIKRSQIGQSHLNTTHALWTFWLLHSDETLYLFFLSSVEIKLKNWWENGNHWLLTIFTYHWFPFNQFCKFHNLFPMYRKQQIKSRTDMISGSANTRTPPSVRP